MTEYEDPAEERHLAVERLTAGADVTSDHAAMLAKALFEIADVAGMPDSYRQTDSRMTLARAVLTRLGLPVDEDQADDEGEDGDDDDL